VTIKEGRPLLLSPREMPFSAIHLENMLKLARLGVKIARRCPAFTTLQPRSMTWSISWQGKSSMLWGSTIIFTGAGSNKSGPLSLPESV